jgi:deferrochelatase/peroxidase EfeB
MSVNRRDFLSGSLGAAVGAGGLALAGTHSGSSATAPPRAPDEAGLATRVPFDGPRQAGVLTPPPAQATVVALDAIAPDRRRLAEALQALSTRARALTGGFDAGVETADDPPPDSGTLGPVVAPDALTVTIGFGASLFDDRYGLAHHRPRQLARMTAFPDDDLDPARTHGDVLLQLCANRRDTLVHALRELLRPVRAGLAVRWSLDGFQSAARRPGAGGARRNLLGFRDGTANPDVGDARLMRRLVWVPRGGGEPAWAAGGTYQMVRVIRMHVEFWDRVGLREQETMIGRTRQTGAPLGGTREGQDPRYDLDPKGERVPLDAHIRLANPRTQATADQRILRRGYNYHRGIDPAGQLDQGLIFVAFNQDPRRQFLAVQRRLAGEPLTDYITPVGGGYFFVPPGARGAGDWVGSGFLA